MLEGEITNEISAGKVILPVNHCYKRKMGKEKWVIESDPEPLAMAMASDEPFIVQAPSGESCWIIGLGSGGAVRDPCVAVFPFHSRLLQLLSVTSCKWMFT